MVTVKQLTDKSETADEMYRLVEAYSPDLRGFSAEGVPLDELELPAFFCIVASLPYRRDETGVEVVSRPYHILDANFGSWDCKKKAILIASWLRENGIPYRFTAVSRKAGGRIHHVIVEAETAQGWEEIDATYPHNELGQIQHWTNKETLSGDSEGTVGVPVLVSMYGDGEPSPALSQSFNETLECYAPEQLGAISEAGVAVVAAIVAAVAGITVAIISAVASRRDRERSQAFQAQTIQDSYALQQKLADQRVDADAAAAAEKKEQLQKLLIPAAAIGAGALLFLAPTKGNA